MTEVLNSDPFKVNVWPEVYWDFLYVTKELDKKARRAIKESLAEEKYPWVLLWASMMGFDKLVRQILKDEKFPYLSPGDFMRKRSKGVQTLNECYNGILALGYEYANMVQNERILNVYYDDHRFTKYFGVRRNLLGRGFFEIDESKVRKEMIRKYNSSIESHKNIINHLYREVEIPASSHITFDVPKYDEIVLRDGSVSLETVSNQVFSVTDICLEISKYLYAWSFKSLRRTCRGASMIPIVTYREKRCLAVTGKKNVKSAEKSYCMMMRKKLLSLEKGNVLAVMNLIEEMDDVVGGKYWDDNLIFKIMKRFIAAKCYYAKWKKMYEGNRRIYIVHVHGHVLKYDDSLTSIYVKGKWEPVSNWIARQDCSDYSPVLWKIL
nr:hypothetical protein K-LCC10_0022 [Kaumoebavirus]